MNLEIRPQPPPEHEAALRAALASALVSSDGGGSNWWRAGIEENLDPEEAPEGAGAG